MNLCPCGNQKPFLACCGSILDGSKKAETAEQLMRSRYSAFATGNDDYIKTTCAGPALVSEESSSKEQQPRDIKWLSLTILSTKQGQAKDQKGRVEFVACYQEDRRFIQLRELSEFHRIDGRWFYVDGQLAPTKELKVNRNAPCPCQSGMKFKKCCG